MARTPKYTKKMVKALSEGLTRLLREFGAVDAEPGAKWASMYPLRLCGGVLPTREISRVGLCRFRTHDRGKNVDPWLEAVGMIGLVAHLGGLVVALAELIGAFRRPRS